METKLGQHTKNGERGKTPQRILVTGGLGFIGSNYTAHCLARGWEVVAYDNFSRPGAEKNAAWLEPQGNGRLTIVRDDVRNLKALCGAMNGVDVVAHLAAQVAVTTSVVDPMEDFLVNALGGVNVLEAARHCNGDPIVLFSSTNKVYGDLQSVRAEEGTLRHDLPDRPQGIAEDSPIDLYSPYGCSKGACDLYMLDYARIYGLKTVVLRQSCIYGPRQFGVEDQGWVAHFVISAVMGRQISIYGDGRQVRDILHVDDLLDVYDRAIERIDDCRGQAYNIGGGPRNALSLLELIYRLEAGLDRAIPLHFGGWRPGDQKVYISDIRKAQRDLGWSPRVSINEGLASLQEWVGNNREHFEGEAPGFARATAAVESRQVVPG